MATSSLVHTQETPPTIAKGHGTAALGPSDSTHSGSDIQGGPGLDHDDDEDCEGGSESASSRTEQR